MAQINVLHFKRTVFPDFSLSGFHRISGEYAGRDTIVTPDRPKAFLCGNPTRIQVDQTKYSTYVLYEFLNSEERRNVLNSIQSGTTIKVFNNTNLSRLPVSDYENPEELQMQFKQIYQEYRMSVKEAESRFETERKKLLSDLQ